MATLESPETITSKLTGPGHPEWQYLDLMRRIWEGGSERIDRTGIGTRSIAGAMLRFDLADGAMPLLTKLCGARWCRREGLLPSHLAQGVTRGRDLETDPLVVGDSSASFRLGIRYAK